MQAENMKKCNSKSVATCDSTASFDRINRKSQKRLKKI